jgi:outer membrane protein assembly factor BamD (BamD/ComL family)
MYAMAIMLYDSVASAFPEDILADDAIYGAGRIYHEVLKTEPNAQAEATKRFQKLIESYPGSTFTVEARKRFRLLRGDVL